jgi:hypothetical protein
VLAWGGGAGGPKRTPRAPFRVLSSVANPDELLTVSSQCTVTMAEPTSGR